MFVVNGSLAESQILILNENPTLALISTLLLRLINSSAVLNLIV